MAETTLNKVKSGRKCRIVKVKGSGAVDRRIVDMGLTRGASVIVRKVAPLGDPIEITVRGYNLSLRKSEAAGIVVEMDENDA